VSPAPAAGARPGVTNVAMTRSGHGAVSWTLDRFATPGTPVLMRLYEAGRGWDEARDILGSTGARSNWMYVGMVDLGTHVRVLGFATATPPGGPGLSAIGGSYDYDLGTHAGVASTPLVVHTVASSVNVWTTRIAVDGAGNALGGVYQFMGGVSTVDTSDFFVARAAGGAWTAGSTRITPSAGAAGPGPVIALDLAGDGVAAWVRCASSSPDTCAVWSRRYLAGAWQADVRLSTPGAANVATPSVAIDDGGRALALWLEIDAAGVTSVMASELDPAAGWTTAHVLEPGTSAATVIADLALGFGPNGTGLAAWTRDQLLRTDVYRN